LVAAHEAKNDALGAYVLGYLSIIATYSREPQEGLAFAEAAQGRARDTATPATCSWLATVEAEAWANLRVRGPTEGALERAETVLSTAQREGDPGWIYHYDRAGLQSAAGTCYTLLGLPEAARQAIEEAIKLTREREVREQAVYLARLAGTHILQGEMEQTCRLSTEAITVAEETGCARAVQRVRELRRELDPWSDTKPVKELDEQLTLAGSWA
jgi:hypothetical protein